MKINKLLIIVAIFSICLFILSYIPTFADARIDTSIANINEGSQSEFDKVGNIIFGVIRGVGIGVSVIVLVIIGIKFMLGSSEERAEYKSSMFPYIIGALFLAGATIIPSIIYEIAITIK